VIHNLRLAVVPVYLMLCLLLGGASAAGIWANFALQLLGPRADRLRAERIATHPDRDSLRAS
jgi:hypothetical protein